MIDTEVFFIKPPILPQLETVPDHKKFTAFTIKFLGPGSSVGIATELRAGRSGIESRWGRDFQSVQTGPGNHPASCKMGTGSFQGVEVAGAWG